MIVLINFDLVNANISLKFNVINSYIYSAIYSQFGKERQRQTFYKSKGNVVRKYRLQLLNIQCIQSSIF